MPVMQPHQFKATPEEIELAECIQRTTARKPMGAFSIDAARRILKESGISNGQIRDICTIADLDGDGKLSNQELCAVVRLAGWAQQQGAKMSESLLTAAGPLPVLQCVPYAPRSAEDRIHEHDAPYHSYEAHDTEASAVEVSEPQQPGVHHFDQLRAEWHQPGPQLAYPPITVAHMKTYRCLFERAGPISGLMDRQTAEEVLMRHLDAPFLLLKTILNLVRNSNRLSLNIREFTLAAYFLEGLQSRTIKTLPPVVPQGLYDQLWTPILVNPFPMSAAPGNDERKFDSLGSAGQSPATSAQSSTSDLGPIANPRLSPVRKAPRSSFSDHCPSVSSVETKKISKLWKRVAKHCKIEKVFKVSPTRSRKSKRESTLSSNVSVKGTVYTDSLESSFEAMERDSFLQPAWGQRVSMDIVRLPLIYPSETGYYPSSDPVPVPVEVRHSLGGDVYTLDHIVARSSVDNEDLAQDYLPEMDTTSVMSDFSVEESMRYEASIEKMEVREEKEATTEVSALLKDMREEFIFLRLQMQTMQKTVQKLHLNGHSKNKNVHFASDVEADLGGRARDSTQMASSRRTQSLKISKELAGPRDMLSLRSGSSSSSEAYDYSHRRHRWREEPELVQGPRVRDQYRESSSLSSLSSLESLSESESECTSIPKAPDYRRLPEVPNGRTSTTLPLRSILKTPADRPQTGQIRIIDHNGRPSSENSSPTTGPRQRKRATKGSGMTEETLQAWNARFIPVDRILESTSMPKQLRKLPRTPRKLPTPATAPIVPKRERSRLLPALPTASSSKFPGALTDEECSASSSHNDSTINNYYNMFVHRDTETETETAPSSAASTPRSSADFSSIFSHRHNSARTTLLTEIDEYNETVVRDLREAAPELVLQVKRCLLRELRTKSDGMYDGVYDGLEDLPQSPIAQVLEEALAQLRAKEEELKRLEDTHSDVLRQQARELTKLEQEKQELQWTLVDQEELIYNLRGPTAVADLSVELPEYTPRW